VEVSPVGDATAALWLSTLEALAARLTHPLRNGLNAVAVNLEVVRSRSSRGGDASAIASFATHAATSFEAATAVTAALVSLLRPEREPVDVSDLALRAWRVVAGPAHVGATGDRHLSSQTPLLTDAPGAVARILVVHTLLLVANREPSAPCEIVGGEGILLRVGSAVTGRDVVPLDAAVDGLATRYGIRVTYDDGAITLQFPIASGAVAAHQGV
jgi:hypothetical protein